MNSVSRSSELPEYDPYVRIPVPGFLKSIVRSINQRRERQAQEHLAAIQPVAKVALGNLLGAVARVFPDQVDASIVDTNPEDLSYEQILDLDAAVHDLAPSLLEARPLQEYADARRAVSASEAK
jgi:hypothetical protein